MNFWIAKLKEWLFLLKNTACIKEILAFDFYYLGINPYKLCRQEFFGDAFDGYVYGETPLYVYDVIGKSLKEGSSLLDLGCGRGRGLFFLSQKYKIKCLGVDRVNEFIYLGNQFASKSLKRDVLFKRADLATFQFESKDAIFITPTCMDDELLFKIVEKLNTVKPAFIFSISSSLEEYGLQGYTLQTKSILMPFGSTDLYILEKMF